MAIKALSAEPCEDTISRQAVIALAKEECDTAIIPYKRLIKGVEKLPPVQPVRPKGEWIPVSERLPESDEHIGNVAKYYLVQNEYGDMMVARYTHGEYWEQMYQFKPIDDEIVAWMTLPEQYKEGDEEC